MTNQHKNGYVITTTFKCNMCGLECKIGNVPPDSLYLNVAVVMAMQKIGIGHLQKQEDSAIFGLKAPSNDTWQAYDDYVAKHTIATAEKKMAAAAKKRKRVGYR